MIRKSLQDIAHMLRNKPYPKPLPAEVAHLHCYVIDGGHCILAIPECFEPEAAAAAFFFTLKKLRILKKVLDIGCTLCYM